MPIQDAAYNGSPRALQVRARSAISPAKLTALVSMITWRRRVSAARGIVRRLTITTSVQELAASKARTSPDPTCPLPPTTKTRKPMFCRSPRNIAGGIFKRHSVAAFGFSCSCWVASRGSRRSFAAFGYTEVVESGTRHQSQEFVGRDSCRSFIPRVLEQASGQFGGRDSGSAGLSTGCDQGSGGLQGS